ncbi:MAG TPA: hypothetical protein VNS88_12275 [Nitrospiraceae bacterium]|nr:hypothetical protein [Nitrospiraceae bacterium]
MPQTYVDVTHYVFMARLELQDLIPPYRYADNTLIRALNRGIAELSRLRPDILLDLKYQSPIRKGDIGDGIPGGYTTADIGYDTAGNYVEGTGTAVPIPSKYVSTLEWFMPGWLQFLDVTDTQDQRAAGFLAKFHAHLISLTGA